MRKIQRGLKNMHSAAMEQLKLNLAYQRNSVANEISAMIAVIRPILRAILFGLRKEIIENVGGYSKNSFESTGKIIQKWRW